MLFPLDNRHFITEFGTGIIDKKNDGTPEHPLQFPFVNYSRVVDQFIDDVFLFVDKYEEVGLCSYQKVLEENGIKWNAQSMETAVVDDLDAKCVVALIYGAIRAERFCDWAILAFLKDGTIVRWLERLKTLDANVENIAVK